MAKLEATYTDPESVRHRVVFIEDEDGVFIREGANPLVRLADLDNVAFPKIGEASNLREVANVIDMRRDWRFGW